jgi:uncharacterized membrane-anchored protein
MKTLLALAAVLGATLAPSSAFADGYDSPPPGFVTPRPAIQKVQPKATPAPAPAPKATPQATTPTPAPATPPPAAAPATPPATTATVTQNDFGQTGTMTMADGAVQLNVPQNFYFAPAAEANAYLKRINAAPPSGTVVGLLAPIGQRPIDDGFWGAVISYNPMGYVAPERIERLAEPTFIQEVRDARPSGQIKPEAFAATPVFDAATPGASWAETLGSQAGARTFRQEHRVLGRSGVAGLTIHARPDQQAAVTAAAPEMARMVSFTEGKTYRDFDAKADGEPQFDVPSLLTNKPRASAGAPAALPAPVGSGFTPVAETTGQSGANPIATLVSQPWFPWAAAGLVGLALLPWIFRRRRLDGDELVSGSDDGDGNDSDPNITPKQNT